ncbi:hypothetical protein F2Q69_00048273 [Brassica cretica]|uniref:Uncharacterized protein n=1 Tax=Brassica cretica TaxID=69181 RepID=A0A8S9PED1_BRACR|nr:hypothetical protein F2Q69_00048273 [Brassica cretica]
MGRRSGSSQHEEARSTSAESQEILRNPQLTGLAGVGEWIITSEFVDFSPRSWLILADRRAGEPPVCKIHIFLVRVSFLVLPSLSDSLMSDWCGMFDEALVEPQISCPQHKLMS